MTVSQLRVTDGRDRLDALAWTFLPLLILALVPIGAISGDGLGQSALYASGRWIPNPNHLLYEPLGAWWQATLTRLHIPREQPDQLTLLSICAGSFALGIFRRGVAGPITGDRAAANIGTLWVAMCAAYATLWVSQEAQMVQIPFLMLSGAATLRYFRAPSFRNALMIGGLSALAALFFVSNVLIVATTAATVLAFHWRRREGRLGLRRSLLLGLVAGAVLLVVFGAAWIGSASASPSFLRWLTSYGGGKGEGSLVATYGMRFTPGGIAVAVARALYGSALAVVDVSPLVDALRSRSFTWTALGVSVVFAITLTVLGAALLHLVRARRADHQWDVLAFVIAYAAAILAFGVYWNNSDDQFYFQLTIPAGALVASFYAWQRGRNAWRAAAVIVLTWNAIFFMTRQVLYPRSAYVRSLTQAVQGAGLVVFPGEDETFRILYYVPSSSGQRRLALTSMADRYAPAEGLKRLSDSVETALANGERVDAVAIFDASTSHPPWKQLAEVGYSQDALQRAIKTIHSECRSQTAGPFSVHSFRATEGACPASVRPVEAR